MTMIRTNYDAIVVGARVAGAPTAMLLARAGGRVLLVDRAGFPSDTVSGHAIKQPGVAYLKRWGLLDDLLETGCPADLRPVDARRRARACRARRATRIPCPSSRQSGPSSTSRWSRRRPTRASTSSNEPPCPRCWWRMARSSVSNRPVTRGRPLRARAPIVIGADGKHSYIAHQVGAEYEQYQAPVSIAYYSYWSGSSFDGIALFLAPRPRGGHLSDQ